MPKLIIQFQDQEWTVDLREGRNLVGRSSTCGVPIRDANLSREHCEFLLIGSSAKLIDLGSMNGTAVNGMRVAEHDLQPGDRVTLGQTVIWYEAKKRMTERSQAAAGVPAGSPSSDSQASTRRSFLAAPSPAAILEPPGPGLEGTPVEIPQDYSLRGRASGAARRVVAVGMILAVLAVAGLGIQALLSVPSSAPEDPDNLVRGNASFEIVQDGRPLNWQSRSSLSVVSQGRTGSCLELDKSPVASDLVAECAYAQEFALGKGLALSAAAWTRFEGFTGWVALRIEWLRAPGGITVAEEYSAPVERAADWTELRGAFTPPAGAGAFRFSLASVGRGGRIRFDDVSLRLQPGDSSARGIDLGDQRLHFTRNGTVQLEIRGRPLLVNLHVRLESDADGALSQAFAREISTAPSEPSTFGLQGRLVSPAGLREVDFEERVLHAHGETAFLYRFPGQVLNGVDRVSIVFTVPESAALRGEFAEGPRETSRFSFRSEDCDIVVEYGVAARVRAESIRGGLRVTQTFPLPPGVSDPEFALKLRDTVEGGEGKGTLERVSRARLRKRYGEALALLRRHGVDTQEGAARDRAEDDARQLEDLERREWSEVQSRAFDARVSRRPKLATVALEALDLYLQRWTGEDSFTGKAEALRKELLDLLGTTTAEEDGARPRRILAQARHYLEVGRKALARALLETLTARFPGTEAASEAQDLLRSLSEP